MTQNGELYVTILNYIRNYAKQGNRLPPEEEMARHFAVSRVKLRDVLAVLQSNGYIMRKKGVGTRINHYILAEPARLDIDVYFEELVESSGFKPSTLVHKIKALTKLPEEVQKRMNLPEQGTAYQIEKTIFADGKPAIFLTDYVPSQYYNDEEIDIALLAKSTFWFVQNYCDELLDNMIVHIDAIGAPEETAKALTLPEGTPILKLSSVCYNQALLPIMYSVECYNTSMLPLSFQKRIVLSKLRR